MERPFSLLIKPAGADCNLNCTYCFYLKKGELYPDSKIHRMSDTVLEKLISSYLQTTQAVYAFGWQGGEPTLMGLPFFKKVVSLQNRYARQGSAVSNGLQTNGTLLNDEMAAFFKEFNFLLGVSIDGPAEIHDIYRKNIDGESSHRRVLRGIRALRRQKTEFNVLTLVSRANVRRGKEVYHYLKEEGFFFHQYIPCVEYRNGTPLPWSLEGEDWGRFLLDIFSAWYPQDTRAISIRQFDAILQRLISGTSAICTIGDSCSQYFVVEHTGDVYPCDFFVDPDLKLGNVMHQIWQAFSRSPIYTNFAKRKRDLPETCNLCPFLEFCYGDCPKHRAPVSVLCEGWKLFYRETLPVFREIARTFLTASNP